MRNLAALPLLLLGVLAAGGQSELCFNQLQVLGSHNSYHQAPPQDILKSFGTLASGPLLAWQYSHPPLTQQLAAGVRAFELDVFWDPEGGRYAQAAGLKIAGQSGWLTDPRYQQPGFKTLHIPDFDFQSSCILLSECLADIKAWSDAHPRHLPIILYLEVKGAGAVDDGLGALLLGLLKGMLDSSQAEGPVSFVEALNITAQTYRDVQAELLSVFGDGSGGHGQLLTPDDVRAAVGAAPGADLRQLLMKAPGSGPCPWPSLDGAMRGKVLPVLFMRAGSSEAAALEEAYPGLAGSLMWVEQAGRQALPQAAFRGTATWRLSSDALGLSLALPSNASAQTADMAQSVREAVAAGFIVRARTDADTVEARAGFTERRDAIIAAGPQVVATDFLVPANQQRALGSTAALYATTYNVTLPGGLQARCLPDFSSSGSASAQGISLELSSVPTVQPEGPQADGVYCGPLSTAPPGRVLAGPEEGAAGGEVAGGQGAAVPQPPAAAMADADIPVPPTQPTGAAQGAGPLAALAAGVAAAAAAAVLLLA